LDRSCAVSALEYSTKAILKEAQPAERNYDVGDRELLAVVKDLKGWRHWLEGAKFGLTNTIWSTLARRLNPRQARRAMFFTHFVFTLSYRPGSKNAKADVLFRMYDTEERSTDPTPILPASCLVAPVYRRWTWTSSGRYVQSPLPTRVQLGVCTFHLMSAII
jgi:hypothetical protein